MMWEAGHVQQVAETYAPLLRFSRYERHLPGEPEQFRQKSRLRESNFRGRKDRTWRAGSGEWSEETRWSPADSATPWRDVLNVITSETRGVRPSGPACDGPVVRPRDERNLWQAEDDRRGFFLELEEDFGRSRSGSTSDRPVPIFYDQFEFTRVGRTFVGISYWFFYVYNWNVLFCHEGDWEHITLYFDPADFGRVAPPLWIYFAAHNSGLLRRFAGQGVRLHDTHPVVYVSPWGHASYPKVTLDLLREYGALDWESWHDVRRLEDEPWFGYDGAWGEVGESRHSTGPLGPWFKRGRDTVKLWEEA